MKASLGVCTPRWCFGASPNSVKKCSRVLPLLVHTIRGHIPHRWDEGLQFQQVQDSEETTLREDPPGKLEELSIQINACSSQLLPGTMKVPGIAVKTQKARCVHAWNLPHPPAVMEWRE